MIHPSPIWSMIPTITTRTHDWTLWHDTVIPLGHTFIITHLSRILNTHAILYTFIYAFNILNYFICLHNHFFYLYQVNFGRKTTLFTPGTYLHLPIIHILSAYLTILTGKYRTPTPSKTFLFVCIFFTTELHLFRAVFWIIRAEIQKPTHTRILFTTTRYFFTH